MKVDLTLLKRLVAELESALATVDTIKNSLSKVDNVELNVEGSKAAGLAAGIMQESSLLVMDIYTLIGGSAPKSKNDFIDKLMGGIKGPGGTN
jgi:hypothetical protein